MATERCEHAGGADDFRAPMSGTIVACHAAPDTPVAAGDYLYFVNEAGLVQIVDTTAEEGEITGKLDLGEQVLGSPAVGSGALYVRSNSKLYKVAK